MPKQPIPAIQTGYAPVNGTRLYYEVAGEGHPLLLIHGAHLDRRMWDDQFLALAQCCRVIRYDVRDHGLSHCPPGPYSDLDDLLGLLQHLEIAQAALLGLSFGGSLAIDFTLAHPAKVSALLPISPGLSGYNEPSAIALENNNKMVQAWEAGDLTGVVEFYQHSWTDGPYRRPTDLDPQVRERIRALLWTRIAQGASVGEKQPLLPPAIERLQEIDVPTLIVVGELDLPDILAIAALLAHNIPGAQQVIMPEVAHMLNMEQPAAFNQIVLDFLGETCML